jgi:hypothetical protein
MTTEVSSTEAPKTPQIRISKKKQALFAFILFTLFLLALEGLLRIIGVGAEDPSQKIGAGLYRVTNNSFGFEYTPGWEGIHAGARVHINSMGWRGRELSPTKPPATIRILGIGDSFTFGKAVNDEDVFLVKLEQMLNDDGAANFEVLNAGRESADTVQELEYFKNRELLKLEPDVVVLGFTVSNDAQGTNNRRLYRRARRDATLALKISESAWFKALSEKSRIAKVLEHGAEWASSKELSRINTELIVSNFEDGSESWEHCRDALLGFYDICHQKNVPLILAIFPDYGSDLNQSFKDYPEEFRRIHVKLRAVLEGKSGAVVVDVTDDLAAAGLTARQIMVPVDGHPNRIWHEIVARRLHDTIKGLYR